ncbi:ABC transporter permease [Sphingomicrobium clamense]|uniref:ABC transporter permease n=1 Tax=Sphingomicrobium clamense TaxID=2851013 RepID=A0ABS6V3B9_9SPHN|nr:ABC transporter permease [Sphingomicrobium sp. B8]MBW0143722.1 ABC transporter permease [Sphingomicrobium sp. B8]
MSQKHHASSVLEAAFVIARRDYSATVLSKTFLFFLIGPIFPLLLGIVFGSIGSQIAQSGQTPTIAVIGSESEFALLQTARDRAEPFLSNQGLTRIIHRPPEDDREEQRQRLLAGDDPPVVAVLDGGLDTPTLYGSVNVNTLPVRHMAGYLESARQLRANAPPEAAELQLVSTQRVKGATNNNRIKIAQAGQFGLFFITLLLATMLLSQMLEEKGNKVIEVLASAVPVDGIFMGKLFAMLAVSLTGIVIWLGGSIGLFFALSNEGMDALPPPPAVGWPAFFAFLLIYFAMGYLLIGAAFLGIGAQASTPRQVQVMSMPVTMLQVMLLFAAMQGVGDPYGSEAIWTAIFPLTSPLAMIARAAQVSDIWPHVAAIAWQALWIAIILKVAARAFRKSVLKTRTPWRWPWSRGKA